MRQRLDLGATSMPTPTLCAETPEEQQHCYWEASEQRSSRRFQG